MAKVRSWVGLDVHARSVLAVTIDGASGGAALAPAVCDDERGGRVLLVVAGADTRGV
jgi:hypothetical protein